MIDRYEKFDRYVGYSSVGSRGEDKRHEKLGRYGSSKMQDKLIDKTKIRMKRESKKYYDNGYEKVSHKSKKNGRQRSRSRDRRR